MTAKTSPRDKPVRLFLALNPVAGHYQPDSARQVFAEVFGGQNIECDIYETTGQENLIEVVEGARDKDYDAIVAGGGDGTVSEVASGLVDSNLPLGILPVGTGNLVARELGIPLDLTAACQLLVDRPAFANLDAMEVERQIYLPQISLGIYAHIIEKTSVEEKRRYGMMAYFWRALQELSGRSSWNFSMSVDDQPLRARASLVMLANIGATGIGDIRWGMDIRPDDGTIDVCIVRAKTPQDYMMALWELIRRRLRPAAITYFQARREISLTTNKAIPMRLEDETVERNHLTVKVLPGAVKVIVPQERVRQ